MDIHTDLLYSHTAYNITVYPGRKLWRKKTVKKYHLRWLRVKFLENWLAKTSKFCRFMRDNQPPDILEMMSLAASGQLRNAMKYCTKVSPAGKELNNSATV